MGTLDKADDGKLFFDNKDISYSTNLELAALRNQKMGFIFQFHHLLPEFTALENVCLPAMISGKRISEVEARAIKLLNILGIDDRSHHRPNQLSGGEQQRVAVARSLINEPDVIFADEPSGNLDTQNAQDLHQLFLTLRDEFGQTFVIVTHNDTLAEMSDKQYHIRDGIIAIN
jgi:lipoprotein-releasing system ATP-binding protein